MFDLNAAMAETAQKTEQFLEHFLTAEQLSDPLPAPQRLVDALRHGALNGGKRLRPALVYFTANLFDQQKGDLVQAGAAIECVHCYSLIHDDLPDMDNDDVRRGKPTVHKAYDPATAILAGDALLTHAFALLADAKCHPDAHLRNQLVLELVHGSGVGGMAGGQMRDIEGERKGYDPETISLIHAMKTGALIRASVRIGALMGGANPSELANLSAFGEAAGRIYQLADDILDATQSSQQLGKTAGKDEAQGKSTLIASHGLDHANAVMRKELKAALSVLDAFGERATPLAQLVTHFAERKS